MPSGTATVNFGAFPGVSDTAVAVTGQAAIVAGSLVEAWIRPVDTADHTADEHMLETLTIHAANIVAGVGFTIYAFNTSQLNEELQTPGVSVFRPAATSVHGRAEQSVGGIGTRLYGLFTVAWVWI